MPEATADVAAELVAPIRRVGYPALREVYQDGIEHSSGHVPQPHRVVAAPRGQQAAVRTERNTPDRALMPTELRLLAPRGHVPQPHRVVAAPRGQQALLPEASKWPSGLNATLPTEL